MAKKNNPQLWLLRHGSQLFWQAFYGCELESQLLTHTGFIWMGIWGGGDTKHCWLRNTLMWFCLSISVCLSKTYHIHKYQRIDLQRQNLSLMHWLTYESWLQTCFYKILFRESYLVFIKYYSNQYLLLICQNVLRITGAGFYPSSLTSLFCFNLLNSD